MPLHDYACPGCGRLFSDIPVPMAIGAVRGAPTCGDCHRLTEWIPQVGAMDAREPFQTFETYDGRNQRVVVDSLRTLRRIERESEQLARNGEGQQITFRRWSQGQSNRDVNTHGSYAGEQPDPARLKKMQAAVCDATTADAAEYGPGVSDSNASALGGL